MNSVVRLFEGKVCQKIILGALKKDQTRQIHERNLIILMLRDEQPLNLKKVEGFEMKLHQC